jgi:pimeloyl-ACP methyl ester carboxylesterase
MGNLHVPGATLYYKAHGTGPVLLFISGGSADADLFDGVGAQFADRFTVVTYDPRGNARSPLDGPPRDLFIEELADDAHRLLLEVTEEPAYVFGSSSGALTAFELLVKHPEQVRLAVAHEPPAVALLPDAQEWRAFFESVHQTYLREGAKAAMRQFGVGVGEESAGRPEGVELPAPVAAMMERMIKNLELFLGHEVRSFTRYEPDVAALEALSDRLVLAGGEEAPERMPYRPNVVLAERLGKKVVDFPGKHVGYVTHPLPFATLLAEVVGSPA